MSTEDQRIRVLVVEDEESYREAMSSGLYQEGFEVDLASNGADGIRRFIEHTPDIVLLDMRLPDMHGTEVCRTMRQISAVPVVMVTAVNSEIDAVLGLELGASDYVTKPFRLRELVARIRAILRRPYSVAPTDRGSSGARELRADRTPSGPSPPAEVRNVKLGEAIVNFGRREVTVRGETVHLSRREFDLLAVLLSPPQQLRSRDELIDRLWSDTDLSDTRTLDTHIHRLRSKLEPDPSNPCYIVTVRGIGFRIDPGGRRSGPPASSVAT